MPGVSIDKSTRGNHHITFGAGDATSMGTITVPTPIGEIRFQVVPAMIPFLLCLTDMDRLNVTFNNIENILYQGTKRLPVLRKWGHPWLLLNTSQSMAFHLNEIELRQLHRRFGHPSTRRMIDLLNRTDESFNPATLKRITEFCHQCQTNSKAPGRFKFNIRDTDLEFNAEIIVDVMYLETKPVLHVVDSATAFQAARFLRSMSTKTAWEAIRACWIDVYIGPPETIVHDAGTNFASIEFRQYAQSMTITTKEVPVEAHHSIGKIERYHVPLKRAYEIIRQEMPDTTADIILQAAIKAVNDTAGPKGLIPTLLVFGAYPRMSATATTPDIQRRANAINLAMKELRELQAQRQIRDALGMRNGPDVTAVLRLSPDDEVLVWREKDRWTGPFKVITVNNHNVTVMMPNGPTNFRSTVVKPYKHDATTDKSSPPNFELPADNTSPVEIDHADSDNNNEEDDFLPRYQPPQAKQGRGRPKGSKNKPKDTTTTTFMANKEKVDLELALQLRADGKITTPGKPFEASDKKEIDALITNGIFRFEQFDAEKHQGRIFGARMVREIKGKNTDNPYEKSRLVIQGFGDDDKQFILTQSPTIQRASQRLILAIAPSLAPVISLKLRDISQAYTQSTTDLNRRVLARLPDGLAHLYPQDTIMVVIKPLYGLAEAGTYWWATYSNHYKIKLAMKTSTYDPCLLISTTDSEGFGVVGIQTDDTIILADDQFHGIEEATMTFKSKEKDTLTANNPLIFNGCTISAIDDTIQCTQKGQGRRLSTIKQSSSMKKDYVEQRARGAYLATICQPEATFDLSVAAQTTDPSPDDVKMLNKRLEWQMNNMQRGLKFVPIDLKTASMYVFVDGSFANNKDLSSQIGYVILLGNETQLGEGKVKLRGNLITWSSTKSKRITRSVLASEIYGMVAGVDAGYSIATSITQILKQLGIDRPLPIVVCTDSFSLYECIVKLGTTKEKRLMIDIMALRQMYERRELVEVRWIAGATNPADAMTKAAPNSSLQKLIDANEMEIMVEGWVERKAVTAVIEPHLES